MINLITTYQNSEGVSVLLRLTSIECLVAYDNSIAVGMANGQCFFFNRDDIGVDELLERLSTPEIKHAQVRSAVRR